jgi:hypothetical protein
LGAVSCALPQGSWFNLRDGGRTDRGSEKHRGAPLAGPEREPHEFRI